MYSKRYAHKTVINLVATLIFSVVPVPTPAHAASPSVCEQMVLQDAEQITQAQGLLKTNDIDGEYAVVGLIQTDTIIMVSAIQQYQSLPICGNIVQLSFTKQGKLWRDWSGKPVAKGPIDPAGLALASQPAITRQAAYAAFAKASQTVTTYGFSGNKIVTPGPACTQQPEQLSAELVWYRATAGQQPPLVLAWFVRCRTETGLTSLLSGWPRAYISATDGSVLDLFVKTDGAS